jgi:hypothetical protein
MGPFDVKYSLVEVSHDTSNMSLADLYLGAIVRRFEHDRAISEFLDQAIFALNRYKLLGLNSDYAGMETRTGIRNFRDFVALEAIPFHGLALGIQYRYYELVLTIADYHERLRTETSISATISSTKWSSRAHVYDVQWLFSN